MPSKSGRLSRRTKNGRAKSEIAKNVLRIGAKEEGTLRRHVLTWTGRVRDSVYFSILDTEWPEVKSGLEAKLLSK